MRVAFVGTPSGTTLSRYHGLQEIEQDVHLFDADEPFRRHPLLSAIELRSIYGPVFELANRSLLAFCEKTAPDIVWVDKGFWIWPQTVARLRARGIFLVHHNTDRLRPLPWRARLSYRLMRRSLRYFDMYFTTNLFDHAELAGRTPPRTELTHIGYDRDRFSDAPLNEEQAAKYARKIQFIGHYEPRTERGIKALADAGLPVSVIGYRWRRAQTLKGLGVPVVDGSIPDADYTAYLKATEIGLCFVSEWNGNQTAGRTFEIPASGTFLLAMRTPQHVECYEEGKEAEFFSDEEELVRKARFYLENSERRREIARRGHERCVCLSDYSWQRYMRDDWAKVLAAYQQRHREPVGSSIAQRGDR